MGNHFRMNIVLSTLLFCVSSVGTIAAQGPKKDVPDGPQWFAEHLLSAYDLIGRSHLTPPTQAVMARWSVQALYTTAKKPVPKELETRLTGLKRGSRTEVMLVLRDARARVGAVQELEGEKALHVCLAEIFAQIEGVLKPKERSGYIFGHELIRISSADGPPRPFGIGVKMKTDPTTKMLRVWTPLKDGPAHKGGIRAGDLIESIRIDTDADGRPLAKALDFSTVGMTPERAEQLLLGREGTRVVLRVRRADGPKS